MGELVLLLSPVLLSFLPFCDSNVLFFYSASILSLIVILFWICRQLLALYQSPFNSTPLLRFLPDLPPSQFKGESEFGRIFLGKGQGSQLYRELLRQSSQQQQQQPDRKDKKEEGTSPKMINNRPTVRSPLQATNVDRPPVENFKAHLQCLAEGSKGRRELGGLQTS